MVPNGLVYFKANGFGMRTSHERWDASLELSFSSRDGITRLIKKKHRGPLMVQKALYPEDKGICHAVILHPPSGVAGGDHLCVEIALDQDAQAVVTTPGATRWYKSNGCQASQSVNIGLARGAHLDYLPCENIVFDEVSALTNLTIHQDVGSSLMAWEMVQLGRVESGEMWRESNLSFNVRLILNERLVWADCSRIDSTSLSRDSTCGLHGHRIFGTMWISSSRLSREQSEELAAEMPWGPTLRAGISYLDVSNGHSLVVMRALSHEAQDMREFFSSIWLRLRESACGLSPQALRWWRT